MSKLNWYMAAKASNDAEVKVLLETYETLDAADPKREEVKNSIKAKLEPSEDEGAQDGDPIKTDAEGNPLPPDADGPDADQKPPENKDNPDQNGGNPPKEGVDQPTQKMHEFKHAEADVRKCKKIPQLEAIQADCREEMKRLENTRKKHATYLDNRELDSKIWKIQRIANIAASIKHELKQAAHKAKKAKSISQIALKRARFVELFRKGFSITNITVHPKGVKKEELKEIMDDATKKSCTQLRKDFPALWARWEKKFLTAPAPTVPATNTPTGTGNPPAPDANAQGGA